jgi:CPA1 family monovalent cation:H+ antiporter
MVSREVLAAQACLCTTLSLCHLKGSPTIMTTATITLFASLLVIVVVLSALATRLAVPSPIVLVVGSVFLSFLPGLPPIELAPELVLSLFLPPLIYASA